LIVEKRAERERELGVLSADSAEAEPKAPIRTTPAPKATAEVPKAAPALNWDPLRACWRKPAEKKRLAELRNMDERPSTAGEPE
jgi:hypothetical protein